MTDERNWKAVGQLRFLCMLASLASLGGRCPPNPLGFFALGLLPARTRRKKQAGCFQPACAGLASHKPPESALRLRPRRALSSAGAFKGCIGQTEEHNCQVPSQRLFLFCSHTVVLFCPHTRPLLLAPRQFNLGDLNKAEWIGTRVFIRPAHGAGGDSAGTEAFWEG
jgi:hypothetical protein